MNTDNTFLKIQTRLTEISREKEALLPKLKDLEQKLKDLEKAEQSYTLVLSDLKKSSPAITSINQQAAIGNKQSILMEMLKNSEDGITAQEAIDKTGYDRGYVSATLSRLKAKGVLSLNSTTRKYTLKKENEDLLEKYNE